MNKSEKEFEEFEAYLRRYAAVFIPYVLRASAG